MWQLGPRQGDQPIVRRIGPFSPPLGLLAVVLILGVGLGFLAALIPAQRSTRLEVLEAIQAT